MAPRRSIAEKKKILLEWKHCQSRMSKVEFCQQQVPTLTPSCLVKWQSNFDSIMGTQETKRNRQRASKNLFDRQRVLSCLSAMLDSGVEPTVAEVGRVVIRIAPALFDSVMTYHSRYVTSKRLLNEAQAMKHEIQAPFIGVTYDELSDDLKIEIVSFLSWSECAKISETNRNWLKLILTYASGCIEQMQILVSPGHSALRELYASAHPITRLFVFYTAYETVELRTKYPQWAFGIVQVDPTNPFSTVLPNSWKVGSYSPWLDQQTTRGQWQLKHRFREQLAPTEFRENVKCWVKTLRPGDFMMVAFVDPFSGQKTWWECQVWYAWRRENPAPCASVYDYEHDVLIQVDASDLRKYFHDNPHHVIDVCKTEDRICSVCKSEGRSFHYCRLENGHYMF